MEGFEFRFLQNRIHELRNEEEHLNRSLSENMNYLTSNMKADIKEKIFNLRKEREKLNKALEYELGVR